MKSNVLFLLVILSSGFVQGQDLIERTLLGLSCQSTEAPNRISKNLPKHKSAQEFQLFKFDGKVKTKSSDEILLGISAENLNKIKVARPEFFNVAIPVSEDKSFMLELYKVKLHADGSKIITPTNTFALSSKNMFYRGILADDFGSIVTLSIIADEVYISVNDVHGTYRVIPKPMKQKSYSLAVDRSREEREFTCESGDLSHNSSTQLYNEDQSTNRRTNQKALSGEVEIYVVCDHSLYQDQGGTTVGTEAFVNLLFTEIISLYNNEDINMVVSEIFVYNTPDTYADDTSRYQTLIEFGDDTPTFNGDIATLLLGGLPNTCSLSGIAWVDQLCNQSSNSNAGPYNINWGVGDCSLTSISNTTEYIEALDVSIVAHEIGHNLGSPHTHSCCWGPGGNQAIDNCDPTTICGGIGYLNCSLVSGLPSSDIETMMSYCGNGTLFVNGFGTLPGNLLRNRVANASCVIQDCTDINETYNNVSIPNGTMTYASNQINILNNTMVGSSSTVLLSAENSIEVNGPFTVNSGADLEMLTDDCNEK